LIFYTVAIVTGQRLHRASAGVVMFLTTGVVFDIAATVCMMMGSSHTLFSAHGFIGYSALVGMIVATILAWRHRNRHSDAEVSRGLHLYSRLAYLWWVLTYMTGAFMMMSRR
jgi:hypothetical protein